MTYSEQLRADLMIAAQFMMDDGFSIEGAEAMRIGLSLAELAGMIRAEQERQASDEKERGTK